MNRWVSRILLAEAAALAVGAAVAKCLDEIAERDPHAYSTKQWVILLCSGIRKPPERRMTVVLNAQIDETITRRQINGYDLIEATSVLENFDEGDTLVDAFSLRYIHTPGRCGMLGIVE